MMLNPTHGRPGRRSAAVSLSVGLAIISTIFFALVFWIWERELLWMLAVILPPIWAPVIARRLVDDEPDTVRWSTIGGLLVGLALLFGIGVLLYSAG